MFITFEGGEGVGKSTLVRGLSDWLNLQNLEHAITREPGGTPLADRIRSLFLHSDSKEPLHKETELCLVSAARSQHVREWILPKLEQGNWVICDRFADSSRVYQQILGGLDASSVESLIKLTTRGLEPDLTLVIDCDPRIAMQRVSNRNSSGNRYDDASLELHQKIRAGFLSLADNNKKRIVVIDGTQSQKNTLKSVINAVKSRIEND